MSQSQSAEPDRTLMNGFRYERVKTAGAEINVAIGGNGPPLLLLHGNPLTHVSWHRIAPKLAESFTVVAPDLRGYGDSSKPDGGEDHSAYSFRAMGEGQCRGDDAFRLRPLSGRRARSRRPRGVPHGARLPAADRAHGRARHRADLPCC